MSTHSVYRSSIKSTPKTHTSNSGLDAINPDDVIYGEYADGNKEGHGKYLELIYLDDDVLRTFSGYFVSPHPVLEELKILLRDEAMFYLVEVQELNIGLAFKHNDIIDIKVDALIKGNPRHSPSCVWTMRFKDGNVRVVENEYQSYFTYGKIQRPANTTNVDILAKVFSK